MANKPFGEVFFHTFLPNGDVHLQGIVLRELPLGHLEVKLYGWGMGENTGTKIIDGKEHKWCFYTNEKEWVKAGDELFAKLMKAGV
jgi:hypothetical protein